VADLRATLIDVSGKPDAVNQVFDQFVYGTATIDDRVASIDNQEVLPLAGSWVKQGERSEFTADQRDKQVEKQRGAWSKSSSDTKGSAFPWRSTVTVVRQGERVPQLLRVTFADGSHQDVRWDDDRRWARFVFTGPAKVTSAELDPERQVLLDADKLNDSRTVNADHAASRRWTADIAALLQALYATLVTL
jgi:hypothetical protein